MTKEQREQSLESIIRVLVRFNDTPSGAIGDIEDELGPTHADLLREVLKHD